MFKRLLDRVAVWLVHRAFRRPPDFVIGGRANPYMQRWWMLPRNPVFNIYVHRILRPDDDRALHDHPWPWASYLVCGSYAEITARPNNKTSQPHGDLWLTVYGRGSFRVHRPRFAHRLVPRDGEVWTVFITGPKIRAWGFLCPDRWVHWRRFTAPDDKGAIGKGCDGDV
jgi:hypothetical protein